MGILSLRDRKPKTAQEQKPSEAKPGNTPPPKSTQDNNTPSRTTRKISLTSKTNNDVEPRDNAGSDNSTDSSKDSVRLNLNLAKTARQYQQEQEEAAKAAHENTLQNLKVEFPERFYQVEGFDAKKFEQNMAVIHTKMEADDPDIGNYLLDIYQNLKKYPEVSTLLTNEQIGLIVNGFKTFKDEEIKISAPKKKPLVDFSGKSDKEVLDMEF